MKGESVGYTVKSMDKEFPISNYPLEQTEFLYDSKLGTVDFSLIISAHSWSHTKMTYDNRPKARDKFEDKRNTHFDYSMFH